MAATAIDKAIAARGPFRPHFQTSFDDLSRTARRALKSMSVLERSTWSFRHCEAKTMPEVADILDCPVLTAWDYYDSATKTLQRALGASPEPLCYKFVNLS